MPVGKASATGGGDPSSLSNFDSVRVTSTHFELDVDFGRKVILSGGHPWPTWWQGTVETE